MNNPLVRALPIAGRTFGPSFLAGLALLWRRALARHIAPTLLAFALSPALAMPALPLPVAGSSSDHALWMTAAQPSVVLAQVNPKEAIKSFLEFLSWVLILLGVCLVAYGAIQIAQGRHLDGVVALTAGFILVMAVPLVYYFAKLAGTQM